MIICSNDFETWSEGDLRQLGARGYARHHSTRILMLAYHIHGVPGKPNLWFPGQPFPQELAWVIDNGGLFCGWNSIEFERHIWRGVGVKIHGWPEVPDERWIDIMHLAAMANVPRSLEGAAYAVGGPKKDTDGHKLMLELTNGNRTPRDLLFDGERLCVSPKIQEKWDRLVPYCQDDVTAEEGVAVRLPPWPDIYPWRHIPIIDRHINDRGILMDHALVVGLNNAAIAETARLDKEMIKLTGGAVTSTSQIPSLKKWLIELGVKLPKIQDEKERGRSRSGRRSRPAGRQDRGNGVPAAQE